MSLSVSRRAGVTLTIATLTLAAAALPARSDEKEDARALALQQTALAAGKRGMTVIAEAKATRPVDSFTTKITIDTGTQPQDAAKSGLEELEQQFFAELRKANLPVPAEHSDRTQDTYGASMTGQPFRRITRTYTISIPSFETDRAIFRIAKTISPDVSAGGYAVDAEGLAIREVRFESSSSKLDAERATVEAEARQNVMAEAKNQADRLATALGVKLGLPMSVSPVEVKVYGVNNATESGYSASCVVVFEILE